MKALHKIVLAATVLVVPVVFNQCGLSNMTPQFSRSGSSVGGIIVQSTCEETLAAAFNTHLYPVLKAKCSSCHLDGGAGKGAFADPVPTRAFNEYKDPGRRATKILSYMVDPTHNAGVTGGAANQPIVDSIKNPLLDAEAEYAKCNTDNPLPTPPPILPPNPNGGNFITTTSLPIGDATVAKDMVWDLSTAITSPAGRAFPGASLRVSIRSTVSATGDRAYEITNVRLIAGAATALLIKSIYVDINNTSNTQTTFATIDRKVGISATRTISQGGMVIPFNFAATDTIRLRMIELNSTTFNPTTFAVLNGAGGVFPTRCNNCHGAAGGLSITTRNALVSSGYVVPFDPASSYFLSRMKGMGGSLMPPGGGMTPAQIQQVEDWIYDGAP